MSAASMKEILTAVVAQLVVGKAAVDDGRIRIVARRPEDVPFADSEMDILIRVRGFRVDDSQYTGAGRQFCRNDRRLEVIPRTRDARDSVSEDLKWLTDETFGQLAIEDTIYNALEEFYPLRADGTSLLIEPLKLIDCGDDIRGNRNSTGAWTWGYSILTYAFPYQQILDAEVPGP